MIINQRFINQIFSFGVIDYQENIIHLILGKNIMLNKNEYNEL